MKTRIVRGEIVVPMEEVSAEPADVAVYVEDVSRADAPATVVGEQHQQGVVLHPGDVVPFQIEIPEERIEEGHLYSVRAHVSAAQSRAVARGDFVSTQSYPVLTRGHGMSARVSVRRV